jgi:hypothetical protein
MASKEFLQEISSLVNNSKVTSGGSASFHLGQNSSKLPYQIDDSNYYKGINVTTKGGYLSPRSGYVQTKFELENGEDFFTDNNGRRIRYKDVFSKGKFQGATKYVTEMGERIVAVYSGLIFILNPKTKKAQYIEIDKEESSFRQIGNRYEPRTQRLNQYTARVNFSNAGDYLVIFDYPDRPVILDGYHAFRSPTGQTDTLGDPIYYVPATVMGCYNSNRLFVADASNSFTAGDPVGSLVAPKAPITFNEVYIEAGEYTGQVFSLGSISKHTPITAMGFLQVLDTSTGVGPMYVATKDVIYSYKTNMARSQWTEGNEAFGTMLLYNAGVIGQKAIDNLNSDIIFMSGDGHIRALTISKEYTQSWENSPMDLDVWDWVYTDRPDLSELTVVKTFANKVFITVKPIVTDSIDLYGNYTYDYAFKGMVVLELDSTSSLTNKSAPVWAGVWTGVNVQDLVECNDELYMFTKDPAYRNQIYQLDPELSYDVYNGEKRNITSRIYTKQYPCDNYFQDKKERNVYLGLQALKGNIVLNVERSNDYSKFTLWKHWEYEAPVCSREVPENLREHYFRELSLGSPEETICNESTGEYGDVYKGVQFRIDLSGEYWRLENLFVISDTISTSYDENMCDIESGEKVYMDCSNISDINLYHTAGDMEVL